MTSKVVAESGPILRLAIVELELALAIIVLSAWTHNLLEVEALFDSKTVTQTLCRTDQHTAVHKSAT